MPRSVSIPSLAPINERHHSNTGIGSTRTMYGANVRIHGNTIEYSLSTIPTTTRSTTKHVSRKGNSRRVSQSESASNAPRNMPVSTAYGNTERKWTPSLDDLPTSRRIASCKANTPALLVQYSTNFEPGKRLIRDPIVTTIPSFAFNISARNSLYDAKWHKGPSRSEFSNSLIVKSSHVLPYTVPALLTSRDTCSPLFPALDFISIHTRLKSSSTVMSHGCAKTRVHVSRPCFSTICFASSNLSTSLSIIYTVHPLNLLAIARQSSFPIPFPAPVTTTTLPSMLNLPFFLPSPRTLGSIKTRHSTTRPKSVETTPPTNHNMMLPMPVH
mmetsp:Transcript_7164/g.11398  ORF Transcript_7164/g.11398 Transcript_7164/m.11398 type:complete len:328 (-) Transcript_7164:235-1218(-)